MTIGTGIYLDPGTYKITCHVHKYKDSSSCWAKLEYDRQSISTEYYPNSLTIYFKNQAEMCLFAEQFQASAAKSAEIAE